MKETLKNGQNAPVPISLEKQKPNPCHPHNLIVLTRLPSLNSNSLLLQDLVAFSTHKVTHKVNQLRPHTGEVIFVGCRQVITLTLVRAAEVVLVDYLALASPRLVRLVGPRVALFLSQSKGW